MAKDTAARSEVGKVREHNEDRFVARESQGVRLLVVADGVGGNAGGEIAANAAVVELADRFFGAPTRRALEERLADAIRDANTAVLHAAESSRNTSAATTLVAAAIEHGRAIIANLGDSRAYLVRDGTARQLTEDHQGDATHSITRFLGDPRGVQPDLFVEDLRVGDRLLLCSDGLTRHVTAEEIAAVAGRDDPAVGADALVDLALARGGEDNVTVVLHSVVPRSRVALPTRRALAIGTFVAVAVLVVATVFALLFSAAPFAPPSPTPSATAMPSASPSEPASPTATASASP